MTAPALSPAEQAEVSRFGAHDEEILRDLAEHADDVIPCCSGEEPATWTLSSRCCGRSGFHCDGHRLVRREQVMQTLARSPMRCVGCGHIFAQGSSFSDVTREVQL